MKKIKRKIALYLSKLTSKKVDEIYLSISKPKGGQADLCSTISFLLAKERKTQPAQIAKELEAQLKGKIKELDIKTEGPYLNFYFNKNFFTSLLKKGWKFSKKKKTIMVEYPSVNPNKPWHVGHLRNALLGDSIANLYSFYGFNVLKLDYIDDLGLQIAQSFWGFKNLAADFKAYKNKFDHFVGIQYVQVAKKFQEKEVEEQVRQILKQMEQGIQPTSSQVKEFVYKVLKEQYKTAYNFNIFHNLIVFESDIISSIFKDGVEKIKSSSILKFQPTGQNANCWVIDLSSEKDFANLTQPQKVVIRSDGTATYIAKDIAFQLWKFGLLEDKFFYKEFDCQPNKEIVFMTCSSGKKMKFPAAAIVVNVIGTEQTYLQKIIRFCLSEMGYKKQAKNYIHLSYEHVTLADKKFSGREGSWIAQNGQLGYSADELLDECIKVALSNIKKELSIEKREEVAKAVAINAIKFWFLKTSPNQKIIFDFSRALSLNGDSGPYLLYSFVRAKNILKKAELKPKLFSDYEFNNFEKEFLAQAAFFEEILEHCIKNFEIHPLCSYSLELAEKFNRFYDNCPVLQSDTKTMQMRLYIVDFYCKLIESIFNIIGFVVVEEM